MEQVATPIADPRIFNLESLLRVVNGWRLKSDRIVFTNGCFDILHRGHVEYLEEAAALGDRLIIGINSDESVIAQGKGPNRPINTLDDRAKMLASLRVVDAIVPFSSETPIELIKTLTPDVLVKGGDWAIDDIVGGKEVLAHEGQVHSLKLLDGYSTSALIAKIRNG